MLLNNLSFLFLFSRSLKISLALLLETIFWKVGELENSNSLTDAELVETYQLSLDERKKDMTVVL